MSNVLYDADCNDCLCKPYCKDVGKKKYCKYRARFMGHIEDYFRISPGFGKKEDIKRYLEDMQKREVVYAKTTLKAYALIIGLIMAFAFVGTCPLYWHIIPLRILFYFIIGIGGLFLLYWMFRPAINAAMTVMRGR